MQPGAGGDRSSVLALVGLHLSAALSSGPLTTTKTSGTRRMLDGQQSCEDLELRSCGERMRELGWFNLEEFSLHSTLPYKKAVAIR